MVAGPKARIVGFIGSGQFHWIRVPGNRAMQCCVSWFNHEYIY
jgi:hypothetical protein